MCKEQESSVQGVQRDERMNPEIMNSYPSHTLSFGTVPLMHACFMFSKCEDVISFPVRFCWDLGWLFKA